MSPQIRVLLKKEIQERRGQLLLCLPWVIGGTIYSIAYELTFGLRTPVAYFWSMGATYACFAPIFLAMRTSQGETTARTRAFSDGLPISVRTRAWIRWAGGALILALPLLLGTVLMSAFLIGGWIEQVPPRGLPNVVHVAATERPSLDLGLALGLLWSVTAIVIWSATALYAILTLIGTRLTSEMQAGFIGAAITAVWVFLSDLKVSLDHSGMSALSDWLGILFPQAMVVSYGYGTESGTYGDLSLSGRLLAPLALNTLLQLGLAYRFTRGYERQFVPQQGVQKLRKRRRHFSFVPWLPTRTSALAWLSLRQSLVMTLPGLVIALVLTLLTMHDHHLPPQNLIHGFVDALPHNMWVIGMLWAIIVGSGLFAAELEPRVGEFWRTRPIPTGMLFAIKFIVGLAAVLLVLDGTAVVLSVVSPNWGHYHSMNWPYIACMVPHHALFFAIAVATTCWLRRPVLGGIAAVFVVTVLQLIPEWLPAGWQMDPVSVYNRLQGGTDFVAHGYLTMAAAMGAIMLTAILISYDSLQRWTV